MQSHRIAKFNHTKPQENHGDDVTTVFCNTYVIYRQAIAGQAIAVQGYSNYTWLRSGIVAGTPKY